MSDTVEPRKSTTLLWFSQVIRVWARIMAALPSSRLLLKNKPFACESARSHTLGLLAAEVRFESTSLLQVSIPTHSNLSLETEDFINLCHDTLAAHKGTVT